jgi:predicted aminopeptidase
MHRCRSLRSRLRSFAFLAGAAVGLVHASGCYYAHLARGQLALLSASEPVDEVMDSGQTTDTLRQQLALSQAVREYAQSLGLEVDGQYTSYVPWEGDRLVTTLVRSRPGEVEPADFWFPLVGSLPYKGYFDRDAAEEEAERLRADGFDVCISPVVAYSTLGWIDDPLTGPMLRRAGSEDELVETLLHELVHATGFWPDDPDFSESVATFIGEEGAVGFYEARGDLDAARRTRARVTDDRRIAAVLLDLRNAVEGLYTGIDSRSPAAIPSERAALDARTREQLAALDLSVRPAAAVAQAARLSDACLAIRGTYAALLPRHESLFEARGADLASLVARLRDLGDVDEPRDAWFSNP